MRFRKREQVDSENKTITKSLHKIKTGKSIKKRSIYDFLSPLYL